MLGATHPEVAQSMSHLAVQLQRRHAEAQSLFEEGLAMQKRLYRASTQTLPRG